MPPFPTLPRIPIRHTTSDKIPIRGTIQLFDQRQNLTILFHPELMLWSKSTFATVERVSDLPHRRDDKTQPLNNLSPAE
jgi:hypothetical protein